jgi:hypothetical protein
MSPRGTFGAFLAFCSQGCSAIREKKGGMSAILKEVKTLYLPEKRNGGTKWDYA